MCLYASIKAEVLDHCRLLLGQGPVEKAEKLGWQDYCVGQGDRHAECCPVCGKRLVVAAIILPQRKSPNSSLAPHSAVHPPCRSQRCHRQHERTGRYRRRCGGVNPWQRSAEQARTRRKTRDSPAYMGC
jgi:hypothetical protein